jgi:hypothetical protein
MILPGMETPTDTNFTANDTFAITRSGSSIEYYKNSRVIYSAASLKWWKFPEGSRG